MTSLQIKNFLINKKFLIAFTIILISIIIGLAIPKGGQNETAKLLELGQKYLEEQNYEQAIVCFEQVLEIEPKSVDAYLQLADAYVAMGEPEKAIEVLEQGLKQVENENLQLVLKKLKEEEFFLQLSGGEEDPRFQACVVDGIYHNGYIHYDLTKEEDNFLWHLIELMQNGQSEEVFSTLWEKKGILLEMSKKYENSNVLELLDGVYLSYSFPHIAFEEYKIFLYWNEDKEYKGGGISMIPIEGGKGYWYYISESYEAGEKTGRRQEYSESECKNGMFEGAFSYKQIQQFLSQGEWLEYREDVDGTAKNGLLDGRLIRHEFYWNLEEYWYQAEYINGRPKIVEDTEEYWFYEYEIDKNGSILHDEETGENLFGRCYSDVDSTHTKEYYANYVESIDYSGCLPYEIREGIMGAYPW